VILEPKERKIRTLLQELQTLKNEKLRKRKEAQKKSLELHLKKKALEEKTKFANAKKNAKRFWKVEGIHQLRKERSVKRRKTTKDHDD